jgi:hypothetical protein
MSRCKVQTILVMVDHEDLFGTEEARERAAISPRGPPEDRDAGSLDDLGVHRGLVAVGRMSERNRTCSSDRASGI